MKPELKAELIRKLETLEGITDDERAALLGLLRTNRTYGLVWEDKPEDIEETLRDQLPVLREVKDKAIIAAENQTEVQNTPPVNSLIPNHLIIEGDNLVSLSALAYTHAGKIDVIYIDPPYNTGNKDFVYNDSFVDKEDAYRHSKWLSFMDRRLRIAKKLLSDRGVIFISIDDNEQANLKLLCDSVFGRGLDFVALIPWRKRTAKADVPHSLSQDYESILCYAKPLFKAGIKSDTRKYYETSDFPGRPWRVHDLTKQTTASERPNSFFTMVNPKNGKTYPANPNRTWAITEETFKLYYNQDRIIFPGDYDFLRGNKPVLRYWKDDDEKKQGEYAGFITVSSLLPSDVGMTQDGTKDISEILGKGVFGFPKPLSLIRYIIKIATPLPKKVQILDFFAGSGTTLHAVMQLNAEDGGHRQCILCTNNENGICENVTYERNKRVIRGYTKPNGEKVEGLHDNNLRYYRTEFISRSRTPRNMQRLVELATDMLCIKEDLYAEQTEMGGMRVVPRVFRYFAEGERKMLIIYCEEYIEEIVRLIAKVETTAPIRVYVFSPCEDPSSELFEPVAEKVEPVALPAAIYNTYKRILPKRRDRRVDIAADNADGDPNTEPDNELGGLFETQDQA